MKSRKTILLSILGGFLFLSVLAALSERWLTAQLIEYAFAGDGEAYTRAVHNLRIKFHPSDPQAYFTRGFYRSAVAKDYSGAASDFQKYIELIENPPNSIAFWHKAIAHGSIGQYSQALATIDDALIRFPDSNRDRALRIELLNYLGRTNEASREQGALDASLQVE